eukprot:6458704-Amphidinium_carterae.2
MEDDAIINADTFGEPGLQGAIALGASPGVAATAASASTSANASSLPSKRTEPKPEKDSAKLARKGDEMEDFKRDFMRDVKALFDQSFEHNNRRLASQLAEISGTLREQGDKLQQQQRNITAISERVEGLESGLEERVRTLVSALTPPVSPRWPAANMSAPPGLAATRHTAAGAANPKERNTTVLGGWPRNTHRTELLKEIEEFMESVPAWKDKRVATYAPFLRGSTVHIKWHSEPEMWTAREALQKQMQQTPRWSKHWIGVEKTAQERQRSAALLSAKQRVDAQQPETPAEICFKAARLWVGSHQLGRYVRELGQFAWDDSACEQAGLDPQRLRTGPSGG